MGPRKVVEVAVAHLSVFSSVFLLGLRFRKEMARCKARLTRQPLSLLATEVASPAVTEAATGIILVTK